MKARTLKKITASVLSLMLLMSMLMLPTGVAVSAQEAETEVVAAPEYDAKLHASYPISFTKGGSAYSYNGSISESSVNKTVEYKMSTILPKLDTAGEKDFYLQADVTVDTINQFWQTPLFLVRSYGGDSYGISIRTDGVYLLNASTWAIGENYKAPFTVEEGKTYDLVIKSTPTEVSVWIDGEFIITYVLPSEWTHNPGKDNEKTVDYTYMNIDPAIKFMSADATVANVVIYNDDVKPIYDAQKNTDLTAGMKINKTNETAVAFDGSAITDSGNSGASQYWLSPAPTAGSDLYFSADVMPTSVNVNWAAVAFHLTAGSNSLNVSLRNDLYIFGKSGAATVTSTYNEYQNTLLTQQEGKPYNIAVAVEDMMVSVWIDGILYLDSVDCSSYLADGYNLSIRYNFGSNDSKKSEFTVSNFKVWNNVEPCPTYDSEIHASYNDDLNDMWVTNIANNAVSKYEYNGTIRENNAKGRYKYTFDSAVSTLHSSETFYYSATVRMDKITDEWAGPVLYLRGNNASNYGVSLQKRCAIVIDQGTNAVKDTNGVFSNGKFIMTAQKDYVITVKSSADKFSMWIDGMPVFEDFALGSNFANLPANPYIGFVMGGTEGNNDITVKNINLWTEKNDDTDYDFALHTKDGETVDYEGQTITASRPTGSERDYLYLVKSDIKRETPFVMSVEYTQSQTNANWSGIRIIPREGTSTATGNYLSVQVMLRETGLYVFGVDTTDRTLTSATNCTLVAGKTYKVSVYSTVDSISVWVNGILYINNAPLKTDTLDFTYLPVNPRIRYYTGNAENGSLETEIADLSLKASASANIPTADEAVVDMINALPAREAVTADDAEAINAAREAYNALDDDAKLLVGNLAKLEQAEEGLRYAALLKGDANLDGTLDICDAVLVERQIEAIEELGDNAYLAGDYDRDGIIEEDDLELIRAAIIESLA